MKKLFALILAVVMICAMSVNVFAETKNVVGTIGGNKGIDNGVTDITSTDPAVKVDIQATVGNVENRYAVDIEYETMSFNVSGSNLVWNVNTLKYEFKAGTDTNSAATATNAEFDVQVINYSDLPVKLNVNCEDLDGADSIVVACAANGDHELEDAIGYTPSSVKADNSKAQKKFTVTVTSTDWAAAGNYYAAKFTETSADAITIGTLHITIAKVTTTTTP